MAKNDSAVATTGTNALATGDDYADFGGDGFQNQDSSDVVVPFLKVLQSGNPEIKPVKAGGVEGAEEGMLLNSVTMQHFDSEKGVLFVPGITEHVFNEWIPITEGGGFVGQFGRDDKKVVDAKERSTEFGKYKTEGGNDLVETYYVYGVLCPEGEEPMPITLAFTSTKIKVYKKWNSALRMFVIPTADGRKINPPIYANLVRITSVAQSAKGFDFHNIVMTPANGEVKSSLLATNDERFLAAKALGELVTEGIAKPAMENAQDGSNEASNAVPGEGATPF